MLDFQWTAHHWLSTNPWCSGSCVGDLLNKILFFRSWPRALIILRCLRLISTSAKSHGSQDPHKDPLNKILFCRSPTQEPEQQGFVDNQWWAARSIENPACSSSRKIRRFFLSPYVQKSVGNLVLQNPSENPACSSSRKSGVFFVPLCSRIRRKTCSSNFIVFCFQRSLKMMHHMNQALSLFFNEQRAAPIECSILATRCHFTLISAVQELSLADINNSKNTLSHSHIAHHGSQRTEAVASTNAQEL